MAIAQQDSSAFSDRLSSARLRLNRDGEPRRDDEKPMSREVLAGKIDMTSATIYRWENAKTDPPFTDVIRLAKALGVSIDWLAGLDGEG